MEKRIAQKLPSAFLDAHIQWHTRKRLREGCDCDFCVEKRAGTRYIGYTPFPFAQYKEEIQRLRQVPCHNLDMEEIAKELVRKERERKRRIVRASLLHIRSTIL